MCKNFSKTPPSITFNADPFMSSPVIAREQKNRHGKVFTI
jgi:hypothetical protein